MRQALIFGAEVCAFAVLDHYFGFWASLCLAVTIGFVAPLLEPPPCAWCEQPKTRHARTCAIRRKG